MAIRGTFAIGLGIIALAAADPRGLAAAEGGLEGPCVKIELLPGGNVNAWRVPTADWFVAGKAFKDPKAPRRLAWEPGAGVIVNGPKGRTSNLLTRLEHGDVEAHIEFMVPEGSNSGVYFQGRYEIQVLDSWGKKEPTSGDCGGIYERWKDGRGFEGRAPRVNASRPPGRWQTFDVIFRAPRFNPQGEKIANACFVKVLHNGTVIHENQEVTGPTRAAAFGDERPTGPLMLQGDHGPVAYRHIWIRMPRVDLDRAEEALLPAGTYEAIARYETGESRKPLAAVEAATRKAPPALLPRMERHLIDILRDPDATFGGKQFACRMLRRIGTEQSVPVLAGLLSDERLAHMARFALTRLPSPRADGVLREALGRLRGDLLLGVISSIADRGDRGAVPALSRLLGSDDPAVLRAALAALGRIGGTAAAEALAGAKVPRELETLRADAYLQCVDAALAEGRVDAGEAAAMYRTMCGEDRPATIRLAAYRGLVRCGGERAVAVIAMLLGERDPLLRQGAIKLVDALEGEEATRALAAKFPSLAPEAQLVLLGALERRGARAAAPAVTRALRGAREDVRLAAARALGTLGDAASVAPLAEAVAAGGEIGEEALRSLGRLTGEGVGAALLRAIERCETPAVRAKLIGVTLSRRETRVVPVLVRVARDRDAAVREAACEALGALAGGDALPAIVAALVKSEAPPIRGQLEAALTSIVKRVEEPDVAAAALRAGLVEADADAKARLLGLLARVGGDRALAAVRAEREAGDARVREAALRAMAAWPTADPMEDLLAVARKDRDPARHTVALRGYVRMLGLAGAGPPEGAAGRCEAAMAAARGTEERRIVLAALGGIPAPWARDFVKRYRDDPDLEAAADGAYAKIVAALKKMGILGNQVTLDAKDAKIHGSGAVYETAANRRCIGVWNSETAWVSWEIFVERPGEVEVTVEQSMAGDPGSRYAVLVGDGRIEGVVKETGNWARFVPVRLGRVRVAKAGPCTVAVKPVKKLRTWVMNLRSVTLTRVE